MSGKKITITVEIERSIDALYMGYDMGGGIANGEKVSVTAAGPGLAIYVGDKDRRRVYIVSAEKVLLAAMAADTDFAKKAVKP